MTHRLRRLRINRIDPSRDPIFPGVWVGAGMVLPQVPTSPPPSSPSPSATAPFELLPEPPMPSIDPEQEQRWASILNMADDVIKTLRDKSIPGAPPHDIDHAALVAVVRDVAQNSLSVEDIAAIYRHRIESR